MMNKIKANTIFKDDSDISKLINDEKKARQRDWLDPEEISLLDKIRGQRR
jgi:hypothetical protein